MSFLFRSVLSLVVAILVLTSWGQAQSKQPNIVFILADDLGWSDTTLYGTTKYYKTPNIDRLAQRGITFTRAYTASPLCSPTRSAILTGLSPARTGLTTPNCHLPQVVLAATVGDAAPPTKHAIPPKPITRLRTDYPNLAKSLRAAGYATGHFGKWHLGPEPYSPIQQGFDVDVPHWPGPGPAGSYVAPWKFKDFDHDPQIPDQHIEDRMAIEAVKFIQDNKSRPFFLNYWMFSVHAPFDAKADLIEKYRQTVDMNDPQHCPTYAAMVESMDDAVGTLIDTLDELELTEQTIIVFTSDNGGNMYNEVEGAPPTSNAPLRGGKASMFEGGTRVPCIVAWPEVSQAGTRTDALVQSEDFYPTFLDALSLPAAEGQIFDGISILPAIGGAPHNDNANDDRAVFQYFPHDPPVPDWIPPSVSVHQGDWKLIRVFHAGEQGQHRYMLFNLVDDIGESRNLAKQEPKQVQELDALIEEFLQRTGAVTPVINPKFDPAKYRPELEGVGRIRSEKKPKPRKLKPRKPGKPVAGWTPTGTCTLKAENDLLIFNSNGGDPHATYRFQKPIPAGDLVLQLVMDSESEGGGEVFWKEEKNGPSGYSQAHAKKFEVQHHTGPREYKITWTADSDVTEIRLDPSRASGTSRISKMMITNADGALLHQW